MDKKKIMLKKKYKLTTYTIFILFFLNLIISPQFISKYTIDNKTIFVDDDNVNGPFIGTIDYPFQSIEEAINYADDSDIIFVLSGIYHENLILIKKISLIGENKYNTIIDGNFQGDVIKIYNDDIEISGFTIKNSGYDFVNYFAGIRIYSNNANINKNIIINNFDGIQISYSYKSIISDNYIVNNIKDGIIVHNCGSLELISNFIDSNGRDGFFISKSSDGMIYDNIIVNQNNSGIELIESQNFDISNNILTGNHQYGIFLNYRSLDNRITSNNIIDNNRGLYLFESDNNYINYNNFINNKNGNAYLENCKIYRDNNIFRNNYWDDWIGLENEKLSFLPYYIYKIGFDFHPVEEPYDIVI